MPGDEHTTAATKRPSVRPARLLILGDALERAIRDIAAIHEQCTKLGLPTGWFDVSDLELLQQRVTAGAVDDYATCSKLQEVGRETVTWLRGELGRLTEEIKAADATQRQPAAGGRAMRDPYRHRGGGGCVS